MFKFMKILKVKDIFELEIAKFMCSYCHSMLPENFDNYCILNTLASITITKPRSSTVDNFIWNELKLETATTLLVHQSENMEY